MLRRRRAAIINKQSIPYGMKKVEYLESSGTEYIDTNLTGTNLSTFGKIAALSGTGGNGAFLYGTTDKHYRITSYMYSTDTWGCHWCLSQPETTTLWGGMIGRLQYGTIVNCDLDMDKKTATVTSPSTTETSVETITSTYLDGIYNNFRIGGASSYSKCRFYELKCKKTGVDIAYFIPALDKTGTPCMFDKITRKKFYNSGTGEFSTNLPEDFNNYTPIEYLESTGTQFIDTQIKLSNESCVECEFSNVSTIDGMIFGSRQGLGDKAFCATATNYWASFGNKYFQVSKGVVSGKLKADKEKWLLNDLEYTFDGITDFETPVSALLFAMQTPSSIDSRYFHGRIHSFSIHENENLKMNFIPCLDPTGTPSMYDTVSQKQFYNRGTGDFLYPSPTSAATYSMRRPQAEYAKMTDTGVRRLYHVPADYNGSIEDYANEHGFKLLNETESPNEEGKYYAFRWVETDTELRTEWYETEPPTDELGNPIENSDEPQSSTFNLRRPAPIDETVYTNTAKWAMMTDTGVRRLYKTPKDYEGSLEDYAIQCGYKQLIETESPNEEGKYYSFRWVETDDTLMTEWFEIDPPQEEIFEENLDNPTE